MNLRKVIMSLSIIATLSLCTLNVAVALESKPTATFHGGYIASATAPQRTSLIFNAPAQVKTLQPVKVYGYLTTLNGTGITDARICIQEFNMIGDSRWDYLSVVSTGDKGYFNDTVVIFSGLFATKGGYHFRAVYDGDAQYERSVSNEEIVAFS
ncbi:MAG TPA: hypothetical protein VED16_01980 [Candidatus Acidoferrum sp.]|nr:hypothetical protein [Candidatus Acidoferrum sp.]